MSEVSDPKPKRKYTKKTTKQNENNDPDDVSEVSDPKLKTTNIVQENEYKTTEEFVLDIKEEQIDDLDNIDDDDDDQPIETTVFVFNNITYLIDSENNLYDFNTFQPLGTFDSYSNTILI